MPSVVFLFRQVYSRDLARGLGPALTDFRPLSVVATVADAEALIQCRTADIVVMGPSYIETSHSLRTAGAGTRRPMVVVIDRGRDVSVRRRAETHGIDLVVGVSNGIWPAVREIRTSWNDFVLREGAIDERVTSIEPPERSIPVVDDVDRSIIQMIAGGYTDREIAEAVFLSHQTIRNRVSRILTYSGARNRTHLACLYLAMVHEGLVPFVTDDGPFEVA